MNFIKKIIRKIIFPTSWSSDAFIQYLRDCGVSVGEHCRVWSPNHTSIDIQRPHMLHIGNYVRITSGVKILCHDFSRSVFSGKEGLGNIGEAGETYIGDNVFIGVNAIILMGSHIGSNSIVAAGAVVTGRTFPEGSVIAGNPAEVICTIEELYEKRKNVEKKSAIQYAVKWKELHGKWPSVDEMTDAFSWCYLPHTKEAYEQYSRLFGGETLDEEIDKYNFLHTQPIWQDYEAFIQECRNSIDVQ